MLLRQFLKRPWRALHRCKYAVSMRNDILNGKSVTRGNTNTDWSMAKAQVTGKAQADELDSCARVHQ